MAKLGETIRRGMFAPVRALLPKNPWLRVLVYALPVLLLLALFGPALDLVLKVFDLILRVLEPMLHTTVGRVLVVLGLTALVVLVASLLLRRRLRERQYRDNVERTQRVRCCGGVREDQPRGRRKMKVQPRARALAL